VLKPSLFSHLKTRSRSPISVPLQFPPLLTSPPQIISGILCLGQHVKCARPVSMNERINSLVQENTLKISRLMQSSRSPPTDPKYFVGLNPEEIVRQCSLTMQFLLKQIPSREFLSPHYKDCPSIQNLRKFKDRVSSSPSPSSVPPSLYAVLTISSSSLVSCNSISSTRSSATPPSKIVWRPSITC
jgi:hypothetical protein